jgi:hypothetical protein
MSQSWELGFPIFLSNYPIYTLRDSNTILRSKKYTSYQNLLSPNMLSIKITYFKFKLEIIYFEKNYI